MLGAAVGTIVTVFPSARPGVVLAVAGLFMGIFVGGWIMALAEVVNVFPVYCRRLGITKGTSWIVITLAAGKTLGAYCILYAVGKGDVDNINKKTYNNYIKSTGGLVLWQVQILIFAWMRI